MKVLETERKRAEEAKAALLRRNESLVQALGEVVYEHVISTDEIIWGGNYTKIFGYSEEEMRKDGESWTSRVHPDDLVSVWEEFDNAVKERRLFDLEYRFRCRDGTYRWMHDRGVMHINDDGELERAIGIFSDITERKRSEEELRERHEELKQSYDALEQAQASIVAAEKLAALGRLTAGVSHEILNPLNIITMSLQLMLDDPETHPPNAEQLRILEAQAQRINKITQELLYFARQRKPERLWLDFNETLQRTLGLLARDLHLQIIAVELTLAEGLPPLLADQDQLQQVVLNLLTNARDAMPKGGRLSLKTKSVQTNGQKFVELRVEDTGEGIAPEHLENLFDPFFTTKPEGEGTGLGLSICQGIVEAHGGSIHAENLPEGGAAFVVRLGMEEG